MPANPIAYTVELFHVAVEVAVVKLFDTDTDIAHKVAPTTGAPGSKDQPLGVEGAVNVPSDQVYVDVPEG